MKLSKIDTYNPNLIFREEIVSSITHILGVLFGLVFIPVLILNAVEKEGQMPIVAGAAVYGISFLMVFTFSSLFHLHREGKRRDRLKIMDHISIYYLIAGTYTPFILVFVNNQFGITLLCVLWALAILGTFFKLYFTGKFEIVSTLIYVAMGWLLLSGADTFFEKMPAIIVNLIIAGAVLYTIGVLFYIWRWFAYHHAIWHLFVLCAAICHYSAILIAV